MSPEIDNTRKSPYLAGFLHELAIGNLPRMWWLLLTSTSLSLAMIILNVWTFQRWEFLPWQMLDIGGSAVFLGLFWMAFRGYLSNGQIKALSPAYFAFWLILMDGYYFNGVPLTGDIATYVLGALAPAIMIIQPPRVFLALLIPNHAIFCGLVFILAHRGNLAGATVFTTLLNGTLGVLIAGLGAWFLYAATRSTFEKTRQVEEKNREAKLAASRLRAILENIPFQAWLKDTEGTFLAVNREFVQKTGLSEKSILGQTCREIYPEQRAAKYLREDIEIVKSQGRRYLEEKIEEASGPRWYEVFKSPVLADDGSCVGTAGLARDITERKEIEARLLAADTAKSEFLATMSHEIRTPMNSVLGYADLLHHTEMTEAQKEYVASINHSGQLLLAVINDILDFSKIEAGKIALKSEMFSLPDLLDRMAAMFRPLADRKGLRFQVYCEGEVPLRMKGDIHRVEQLLVNLLSNAVKFTTAGEVRLCLTADRLTSGSRDWRLTFKVTDTGIGIPPTEVERLFKPFSQIDSAMSRRFSGTGLGLVIVKRLCQLMDGTITVDSRYGQGTVFTAVIQLPEEDGLPANSGHITYHTHHEHEDLSSCRVLVVEDNQPNRRLVTTILARWKIQAVAVEGGEEAIREVKKQSFDLILMDIQMPGMDGLEATRIIREWEASRNLPRTRIVALTAFALADDSARCLEAGMDSYLSKPLDLTALREVVLQAHDRRAVSEGDDFVI